MVSARKKLLFLCLIGLASYGVPVSVGDAQPSADVPDSMLQAARAPDSKGSGAYPAIKNQVNDSSQFVVYRPADLAALRKRKMPIYVFGNGACSEDGASARQLLLEVASHGYLAIATGGIYSGPGVTVSAESFAQHRDKTRAVQLGEAINWAVAENRRAGSPLYGRIDTQHVAVSGFSCGGIQALKYAGDSRISTFVIMNSGILNQSVAQSGEMAADKSLLKRLSVPVLYVLGGPRDIAYPNGMDDFKRISGIPAAVINTDTGHGGTYDELNGGRAAQAVVAWLDWQLRGDPKARGWFVGAGCTLCRDPAWTIERKGF